MDFAHDVHDWLGRYPYESIAAPEVETLMRRLGFEHVKSFTSPVTIGLFGLSAQGLTSSHRRRGCAPA
jgi:hypothetical protein